MKYQHTSILTTLICFGLFLLMGISNVVFAETSPVNSPLKIFKIEDGATPPKTAICLVVQEKNIFCMYDNKYRDNANDPTKIFDSDTGKLVPTTKAEKAKKNNEKVTDVAEKVSAWLQKVNPNQESPTIKDISEQFAAFERGEVNIDVTLFKTMQTPTLVEASCQTKYNTVAPLITYEAFALFVHDLIQKPTTPSLIKDFCDSNPATALVFLDGRILPLLQNPEMVKLLNDEKVRTFLESVKSNDGFLALFNPDTTKNSTLPKTLEILGKPDVLEQLKKDEVVNLLKNPEVVKALVDKEFPKKINEAIEKYSEIKTLLSSNQEILKATQTLLENAKKGLSSETLPKSIVDGVSNTFAEKLTPLEDKLEALNKASHETSPKSPPTFETLPESQIILAIVVVFSVIVVLLGFFWIYEHYQWKGVLIDEDSIIRSKFVELNKAQSEFNSKLKNTPEQIRKILSLLATQKTTPESPPPNLPGGEETGIGDTSKIQPLAVNAPTDAVAPCQPPQPQLVTAEQTLLLEVSDKVTALVHYQTQQQSLLATQQMFALGMLEQINLFKMALTNYQLEKQYVEITEHLNFLRQQSQDILSRLPAESLWPLLEKSSQTISQVANDLQTLLTVPVTLNGLTQSLVDTREELKTALTASQNQMVQSLEPLDEKVAEIDKLLKSKKSWEEAVLTPVKGFITESQTQQQTWMTQSLESLSKKVVEIDDRLKSPKLWEAAVLKPVKGFIETTLDFYKQHEAEKSRREALERDRDALLTMLNKRFGFLNLDPSKVSQIATTWATQPRTWSWSQTSLWQQLAICRDLLQQLRQREVAADIQEILTLLFEKDQQFLTHWETLTSQNFDSHAQMWNFLRTLDGGKWLNRLFRTTDLLHTYFTDKPQLRELAQGLTTTKGLLTLVLTEMGIRLREPPKLLENVPNDIPDKSRNYVPSPLLKKLVKSKVVEKAKTAPHLIVDIEAYGFITAENLQPEIRVVVFSQAEW